MNEEAKSEEQAPAFGPGTKTDDIIIDYKPAEKPEEPGKFGEDGESDGSEGSGETDETENPDGTYTCHYHCPERSCDARLSHHIRA